MAPARYPLSRPQQDVWLAHQLDPTSYNEVALCEISGRFDCDAWRAGLQSLLDRHDVLRTSFAMRDGDVEQTVHERAAAELTVLDATTWSDDRVGATLRELALQPFDLTRPPLIRGYVVETAPDRRFLLHVFHHIVLDGTSWALARSELDRLYQGIAPTAPRSRARYADYVAYQRHYLGGSAAEADWTFWREHLAQANARLGVPTDRPRPPHRSGAGDVVSLQLSAEQRENLQKLATNRDTTPYRVVLAALQALLYRYAASTDVVIACTAAGRTPAFADVLGHFVNPVMVRTQLDGRSPFDELLSSSARQLMRAMKHQMLPVSEIVQRMALRSSSNGGSMPFDVVMSTTRIPATWAPRTESATRPAPPGVRWRPAAFETDGAVFWDCTLDVPKSRGDLAVQLVEFQGGLLSIDLTYDTDLFERSTIERIAEQLAAVLDGVSLDPTAPVAAIPLMSPSTQDTIVRGSNAIGPALAPDIIGPLAAERIAAQVARTPDATAIHFGDTRMSYRELDTRSNQLAHHLIARGAQADAPIAVLVERSPELIVALLAVWKAGAAYVPLDPRQPADRLGYIIADAGATLVVTTAELATLVPGDARMIALDSEHGEIARRSSTAPRRSIAPAQLAYAIYTSGSTGKPKGVGVPHAALANFLASMERTPGLAATDTLLAVTTISFDIAGLELWLPLCVGATVALCTAEEAGDPERLAQRLEVTGATLLQATPVTWRMLVDAGWTGRPDLVALCGGEALPAELARALVPKVRALWNVYGPTETTIWSAARAITAVESPVRFGGPLANTQLYVLDHEMTPLPVGVAGELYIGGLGLARGYVGRAELTADKFVPDPFGANGGRLYRTGDRVRWRDDGMLEFLGRRDHQVKLRGFRIELGEIEGVLADHPSIKQAAVALWHGVRGPELVGYVVPEADYDPASVRPYLAGSLPEYMIPAAIVSLDAMPTTTSGKLDRKALPAPNDGDYRRREFVAPRTAHEERLAAIWRDLLGAATIGADDHFFEIGAHSLLAIRLVAEIARSFGVQLPIREVFHKPTLADLAAEIARHTPSLVDVGPQLCVSGVRSARVPPPQRGVFRLDRDCPTNAMLRHSWWAWLDGPLDADLLERALLAVRERHAVLRTRFVDIDGEPMQQLCEPGELAGFVVERADLTGLTGAQQDEAELAFHARVVRRPFKLAEGDVMHAGLAKLSATRHRLVLCIHVIACDALTTSLFVHELGQLWRALIEGRDPTDVLAPVSVQNIDLGDYLSKVYASALGMRQRELWDQQLRTVPPLELPVDFPRKPVEDVRAEHAGYVSFPAASVSGAITTETMLSLERVAAQQQTSVQVALLAALAAHLAQVTAQNDIAIAGQLTFRHLPGLERAFGFFPNPLVLAISTAGAPTFRELITRTLDTVASAYDRGDCDVLAISPHRLLRLTCNYVTADLDGTALEVLPLPTTRDRSKAPPPEDIRIAQDMILFIRHADHHADLFLAFNRSLFREESARRFLDTFVERLAVLCADPDRAINAGARV